MNHPDDFINKINKIICGDCLKVLKELPDESIDMVMTSPPYWALRDYQIEGQIGLEETFEEYLTKILEITAEIKRVLKKSGQFWLNMGDCYGSHTFGNSKSAGGIQKKLCQEKEGFPRYSNKARSLGDKCLGMIPERLTIKMIDNQGWILRNKIKWAKQILNYKEKRTQGGVMPTSVKDRFNESGEELYFFVKNKKYYSNLDAVRLPNQVMGVTEMRPSGFIRRRLYPNSKYNKFDYRAQDIKKRYRNKTSIDPNVRGLRQAPEPNEPNAFNIKGKNLPTIHLVEEERNNFIPFSFEKQIAVLGIKEFENLENISTFVENQLINSSAGMKSRSDISTDDISQNISNIIQEFFSSRKIQPYLTLFRGSPYATIAIKNTSNEISIIFGRNIWIFSKEGFSVKDTPIDERDYKWFAFKCDTIIPSIFPLFNWVCGFQLGTDYIKQLNIGRSKLKLGSLLSNITIGDKQAQEISTGRSNFAKVFLVESILAMPVILSRTIAKPPFIMHITKSSTDSNSFTTFNTALHILNISDYLEKSNRFPTIWLIQTEPHNFQKELGIDIEHFAIYPEALLHIPIKFGCPENGIVLDPFMGSGTTAIVAKKLGRNYIGIELNKSYCKIAEKRLKATLIPLL